MCGYTSDSAKIKWEATHADAQCLPGLGAWESRYLSDEHHDSASEVSALILIRFTVTPLAGELDKIKLKNANYAEAYRLCSGDRLHHLEMHEAAP